MSQKKTPFIGYIYLIIKDADAEMPVKRARVLLKSNSCLYEIAKKEKKEKSYSYKINKKTFCFFANNIQVPRKMIKKKQLLMRIKKKKFSVQGDL